MQHYATESPFNDNGVQLCDRKLSPFQSVIQVLDTELTTRRTDSISALSIHLSADVHTLIQMFICFYIGTFM